MRPRSEWLALVFAPVGAAVIHYPDSSIPQKHSVSQLLGVLTAGSSQGVLPQELPSEGGSCLSQVLSLTLGLPASTDCLDVEVTKAWLPWLIRRRLQRTTPASELPLGSDEASLGAASHFQLCLLLSSASLSPLQVLSQECSSVNYLRANLRATFLGRKIYDTVPVCSCCLSSWVESST